MSNEARRDSNTPRRRLTPVDVQQQVFRRATFRGYHEQDVDDFLDQVTEELALLLEEHRRLREQLQSGATQPVAGAEDVTEAKRMADDIVLRARREAEEILRRARIDAASGGAGSIQPFLSAERVFLRDLSRLIQSHADAVRGMARAGRPAPSPPVAAEEVEPGEEGRPDTVRLPEPEEEAKSDEHAAAQGGSVKELFYGED
jgi:DivIVA domain-containing protein